MVNKDITLGNIAVYVKIVTRNACAFWSLKVNCSIIL